MSNLVATHAQKASEAEQGNHIIFFSPSLKPCPSRNIFHTTNSTSKHLNCFVLECSVIKINHLKSLLVNLVVDNILVDGLGFHQKYLPPSLTQAFGFKDTWTAEFNAKIRVYTLKHGY